jgi:hypothetical protein
MIALIPRRDKAYLSGRDVVFCQLLEASHGDSPHYRLLLESWLAAARALQSSYSCDEFMFRCCQGSIDVCLEELDSVGRGDSVFLPLRAMRGGDSDVRVQETL